MFLALFGVFALPFIALGQCVPNNPDPVSNPEWSCNLDDTANITWDWSPTLQNVSGYRLQVDDNSDFSSPFFDQSVGTVTDYTSSNLSTPTTYYARVQATFGSGGGDVVFSDSFTESSNTPLGSHAPDTGYGWVQIYSSGFSGDGMEVNSSGNLTRLSCGLNDGTFYRTQINGADDVISSPDYVVSVTQVNGDTQNDMNIIGARIQDPSNGYAFRWNSENNSADNPGLYKLVNGSWSQLDNINGIAISNGDKVSLKVEGSVISALVNDVAIVSYNDPSPFTGAGYAGVGMGELVIPGDDCDSQVIDDFSVTLLSASCTGVSDWSSTATVGASCDPVVADYEYCRPDPSADPDTVQFFDISSGGVSPYSWDWDFGDGTPDSQDQYPLHTFSSGFSDTKALYTFEDGPGGSTIYFQDLFSDSVTQEVSLHSPDVGSGWAQLHEEGPGDNQFQVDSASDDAISVLSDCTNETIASSYRTIDSMSVADYQVSAVSVKTPTNPSQYSGIGLRVVDAGNFYAYIWNTVGGKIIKQNGGVSVSDMITLANTGPVADGSTVVFRAVGNTLTVLVDGTAIASVSDSTFTSPGYSAFGSYVDDSSASCTEQRLDNFTVSSVGDIVDVCYAIAENNRWYESVNPITGDTTVIGQIGSVGDNFKAIATDPATNLQYTNSGNKLAVLDPNTGALTWRSATIGTGGGSDGNITFSDLEGLSFDPTTGYLWASHIEGGSSTYIFRIDQATGQHVPNVFGSGVDYKKITGSGIDLPIVDIAIDPTDGQMYAIGDNGTSNDSLYRIDKTTGSATLVGYMGIGDVKGAGFGPYGQLYVSTSANSDPSSEAESMWEVDKTTASVSLVTQFSVGGGHESIDCLTYGTVISSDSNATLTDVSANNNDGTLTNMGNNDWVAGVSGLALQFDGIDDYVTIPNSLDFVFGSGKIEFDFRLDDTSSQNQVIFAKDSQGNNDGDLLIIYNTDFSYGPGYSGAITARLQDGSSDYAISSDSSLSLTQGQWYSFELWFGGSGMTMTIDSTQQADTNPYTGGLLNNGNDILLGASNHANPSPNYYSAVTLDNLGIYESTASGGGPYTVQLTVTDSMPTTDTENKIIDPSSTPTCNFALTGATATSCATMSLVWDNPDGTDSYEIFRSQDNGAFSSIATVDAQNTAICGALGCSYDDSPVSQETRYDYYIEATQFDGNILRQSNPNQGDDTPTCLPSGVSVSASGCSQLDVSWVAPPGVTVEGYNVYRSFDSGGPFEIIASGDPDTYCPSGCDTLSPANTTSYSDSSVFAGVGYYYNVTAVVGGSESSASTPAEYGQTKCFQSPIFIEN